MEQQATGEGSGASEQGRRLIDAHSHLFGPGIWERVAPVMEAQGIEYIVNLSGGSPRRGMTEALALARDSGGRVINFMNIDWQGFGEVAWAETVAAELELAVRRYGYGGLKVYKALGLGVTDESGALIAVDDPRLFPLWQKAGELGVPVYIHTADPWAFWEPVTPENERYAELSAHPSWSFASPEYPHYSQLLAQRDHLVELFAETTFILVHFASAAEDVDYLDRLLARHPNVYLDISARVPEIGRHDPARVRELFVRYPDRILFGTDIAIGRTARREVLVLGSSGREPATPNQIGEFYARHYEYLETDHRSMAHPTPIQGDWTVDAIRLPASVLDRVYYRNAYDLVVAPWLARNGRDLAVEALGPATGAVDPR
ncbi:MAG: amidohydrolase family protein [Bradymonadales bacterium]|nr:amidohydrolase family protein [Bradymonadales bacterium]